MASNLIEQITFLPAQAGVKFAKRAYQPVWRWVGYVGHACAILCGRWQA